jgi:DNA-binding XRE family transcriptional regulator
MNTTSAQRIEVNGTPFAIIPFDEYQAMCRILERIGKNTSVHDLASDEIPHAVVEMTLVKGFSLLKAWRVYLHMTQKEAAGKIGVSQAALSRMEGRKSNHRQSLEKIAAAYGVSPEQLTLDD